MVAQNLPGLTGAHGSDDSLARRCFPDPRKLRRLTARGLLVLLSFSVLTMWVRERWPLGLFQCGVCALASLWPLLQLERPFQLRGSPVLIPLGAILCWGALQNGAHQTVYAWETWNSLLLWGTNFVIAFLALQVFADPAARRRLRRFAFYFGFAISVLAIAQMFTSPGKVFWLFPTEYADYVLGPFVSRNQYAAFMELLLPVGLAEALTNRARSMTHVTMASVMLASVVAGASRAGTLLIGGEVLGALILARIQGPVRARAMALALAQFMLLSVVFTGVVGWGALWHRFQESDPYGPRSAMLRSSLDMTRERPWMGFGLGTWSTVYPRYAYYDDGTVANQAHNDWAQWSSEGGVPLLLMMLSIALWSLRPAVRSLWGIGLIAVWLHCLVDSPLQNPTLAGWFFLLLGALAAEWHRPAKGPSRSTEPAH